MPYYEDYPEEGVLVSPRRTVTEAIASVLIDIGGFIEPQFVDEVTALETPLGWRAIPGKVTSLIAGGQISRMDFFRLPGNGLMVVNEDKYVAPVHVGDTLHVEMNVVEKRLSSKAGYGLVKRKDITKNQKGQVVMDTNTVVLAELRPAT